MPKFLIEAVRHHTEIESASFVVEAENADAALALAKAMEDDDELDWSEDDAGYYDNYTWEVAPDEE